MDTKVHVCTGTCQAVVSDEQFQGGLTKCGAPQGCTHLGQPFEDRMKCGSCGKLYQPSETHSHP